MLMILSLRFSVATTSDMEVVCVFAVYVMACDFKFRLVV
jgi:hypothetical protein